MNLSAIDEEIYKKALGMIAQSMSVDTYEEAIILLKEAEKIIARVRHDYEYKTQKSKENKLWKS